MTTALAVPQHALEFTPEQRQMIRDTFASGATDPEFAVLMETAKARGLNPLLKQIHFVKRWDKTKGREVWSNQVSIDGLRAVAERTGKYDGQDEAEYEYENGKPVVCRVKVYKKGIGRPFVGVAHWAEYVQIKKDGEPTSFWSRMPHVMLAKCAEAVAFRKGFPEDMSGLYVPEEMGSDLEPPAAPRTAVLVARAIKAPARPTKEAVDLPTNTPDGARDVAVQAAFDGIATATSLAELEDLVVALKALGAAATPEQFAELRSAYSAKRMELINA